MTRRRSLLRQSVETTFATAAGQVIVAVIYLVAARETGPVEYGAVAAVLATSIAIAGFVDFGTNAYWTRELARDPERLSDIAGRMWTKIAVAVLATALAILVLAVIGERSSTLIGAAAGVAVLTNLSIGVFLRAMKRSDLLARILIAQRAFEGVLFAALLFVGPSATHALAIAVTSGPLFAALITWFSTPQPARPPRTSVRIAQPWRGSLSFGIASVSQNISSLDLWTARTFGGLTAAGEFAGVNKWTQPMGVVSSSVTASAAPFFATAPSMRAALRQFQPSSALLMATSAACVAIAIFADSVVLLLLGDEFRGSGPVLQVLALATAISVWNQPAAVLLQARDRDRTVAWVRFAASVGYIALAAVWAGKSGALGVAVAFLVLQAAIFSTFGVTLLLAYRRTRSSSAANLEEPRP